MLSSTSRHKARKKKMLAELQGTGLEGWGFLPWYKREGTRYPRLILLCLYLCFTFSVAGDFTGLSMPKSISFVSADVLTALKVHVDSIRHTEGRLYYVDLTPCQGENYFPFICKISLTNLEESCAFPQRGRILL